MGAPVPGIETCREIVRVMDDAWPRLHVLVIGDVMLDKYIWGEVERISPEAPIPIVRASRLTEQPGGAANVAMNIAALGAHVTLAGFRGDDVDGAALEQQLKTAGVARLLSVVAGRPTTAKTRILGGRQQMLRLDVESSDPMPSELQAALLVRVLDALDFRIAAVILSDYAKGTLSEPLCRVVINRAKTLGIPVIVDPKGQDYGRYRGATTICPNLTELAALTQQSTSDLDAVLAAGEALVPWLDVEWMTVTLSERGITVLDGKTRENLPAQAKQVFDVSGAGDTVTAVLALCLAAKIERVAAMQLANLAAGIVVGKTGTAPVHACELIAALRSQSPAASQEPVAPQNDAEGKVLSLEQMTARADTWRAAGDRIVFTNGCFDLFHAGHITLLEEARRHGARLIVGLNSDASVRRLKGPSRPVYVEAQRARLLAALSAVDGVVIFKESTPLQLVLALRPDVLVKGSDYLMDEIVGAAQVKSWNGEVVRVPVVQGLSTTQLLARVLTNEERQLPSVQLMQDAIGN